MLIPELKSFSEDANTVVDDYSLVKKDPDTEEGQIAIADEVEQAMSKCAKENMVFFNNGEEALKEFCSSEEYAAIQEARRLGKRTYVRLGMKDDLTRRSNMACLILAREHNDPLWKKLAKIREAEKKTREAIYAKYGNQANRIAKISQREHIKDMKSMPSAPTFNLANPN